MSKVQRFKGSLTDGYWRDNPENLVRDDNGEYVKYEDYKKLEEKMNKLCQAAINEIYYVGLYKNEDTQHDAVERLENLLERELQ